jgi:transcriptional regulator with XRE-family HTH domain
MDKKTKESKKLRWPNFGDNLVKLRALLGKQDNPRFPEPISQEELAKRLRVSRGVIAVWERDFRRPKLTVLEKICFLWDLDPQVMTNGELQELGPRAGGRVWPPGQETQEKRQEVELLSHFISMRETLKQTNKVLEQLIKLEEKRGAKT